MVPSGERYVNLEDDVQVYRDEDGVEEIAILPQYTKVSRLLTSGEMAKIQTSDDLIGWVSAEDITPILQAVPRTV